MPPLGLQAQATEFGDLAGGDGYLSWSNPSSFGEVGLNGELLRSLHTVRWSLAGGVSCLMGFFCCFVELGS
jgi:hypothetical protein